MSGRGSDAPCTLEGTGNSRGSSGFEINISGFGSKNGLSSMRAPSFKQESNLAFSFQLWTKLKAFHLPMRQYDFALKVLLQGHLTLWMIDSERTDVCRQLRDIACFHSAHS